MPLNPRLTNLSWSSETFRHLAFAIRPYETLKKSILGHFYLRNGSLEMMTGDLYEIDAKTKQVRRFSLDSLRVHQ